MPTRGITDYWVVSLVNDVVEVYRDPPDGAYRTKLILKSTESVSPLSFRIARLL